MSDMNQDNKEQSDVMQDSEGMKALTTFAKKSLDSMGPRTRAIVLYFMENPESTQTAIAKHFNVSLPRVNKIFHTHSFTRAITEAIKARKTLDAALAYKSFKETLRSGRDDVKLKASIRMLEETGNFGPERRSIEVEHTFKDIKEMQEIVKRAASLPEFVIDAEIVSGEEGENQ